jgi:hypothetical protein
MKTFKIEISETLSRVIEIEADTVDDAISIVNEKYKSEEIILDESDYIEYEIRENIEEIG